MIARDEKLREEWQPSGARNVVTTLAQEPEEQRRIEAGAHRCGERKPRVSKREHQHHRQRLRDEHGEEGDLDRRFHHLARIEAGGQDLYDDETEEADAVAE